MIGQNIVARLLFHPAEPRIDFCGVRNMFAFAEHAADCDSEAAVAERMVQLSGMVCIDRGDAKAE